MKSNVVFPPYKRKPGMIKSLENMTPMAIDFFNKLLFTKEESENIEVKIEFTKYNVREHGHVITQRRKKKLIATIVINLSECLIDNLTTIAHEFIHIKQEVTGLYKQINENECIWDGEKHRIHYTGNLMIDKEMPWERDAHKNESILVGLFLNEYNGLCDNQMVENFLDKYAAVAI